jgi:hypothetical protein
MYFYQRSGLAKRSPNVESCWADGPAYIGSKQDVEVHDVTDRKNAQKVRNMSGGWFDAGDTNKYVTFALQPVHQLLTAYSQYPSVFTDSFNIPESGNGIPDIIDEIKWEIDWLRRMQFSDGSVALKVGVIEDVNASPPSADKSQRYYIPACTSSTIAAASMFAHASYVFSGFTALTDDSRDLADRARKAWSAYHAEPHKQANCDTGVVKAGDADLSVQDQEAVAVEAAIYLFAVTSDNTFAQYVKDNYKRMRPYRDFGWSRYQSDQGESLLFFAGLENVEQSLRDAIMSDKRSDIATSNGVYGMTTNKSLYRSYMHPPQFHWGSNNPRAGYGNANVDAMLLSMTTPESAQEYRERALSTLHYFHGVNPFGMVYLSNMYDYGASKSVDQIYHTWFKNESKWDDARLSVCGPPPGFLVGGPNASAATDGVPTKFSPPTGQPPDKSYKDWNSAWPENSWTVTEPGIYYQSSYLKLLASLAQVPSQ